MRNHTRRTGWVAFVLIILVQLLVASHASSASPFAPNVLVSDDLGTAEQRRVAATADPSGNVFLAWQDARGGDFDIYVATSRDGGRSFGPSVGLRWDGRRSATQERPALALGPEGQLVVAWQEDYFTYLDFDIFASASYDGGKTFTPPARVSDAPGGSTQLAPSVAVDFAGRVYVAWQDFSRGNGDIRLARASLGAALSFEPSVRVDDDPSSKTQSTPSVAVDSLGTVFVAYHDNRTGEANVFLAKSTDRGATFSSSVRIDDTGTLTSAQGLVSLAADSLGNLFAVWQDDRNGDFDIFFAKSTDGGRSFSQNVRVDDGSGGSPQLSPRIGVGAAGTLYVAWEDGRNVDSDVYFSYSVNRGSSFAASVRVDDAGDSTTNPAYQYGPQVVESNTGLISVAWQDGRRDNGDVYASAALLPVGSALRVRVTVPAYAPPGEPAAVGIQVTSNGTGVVGATIAMSADATGSFTSVVSLGGGSYETSFIPAPGLPIGMSVTLTAGASKSGFATGASRAALELRPTIGVAIEAPWDLLAVGQSMEVLVRATDRGNPLPDAAVTLTASAGGFLSSTWGLTDSFGTWRSVLTATEVPSGGVFTLTASVAKDEYASGSARLTVSVLSDARSLEMQLATNRWEMMSYETATITVRLTSGGAAVLRARITASSQRGGNFSSAGDHGDGTYSFGYDAPWVASPAWSAILVRADVGGYATARGRVTLLLDPNKTNPADPTQLFLLADPESYSVAPGGSIRVTVHLHTVEGYAVSGAKLSVVVRSGLGIASVLRDELNGIYTFTFTASMNPETGVLVLIGASKYGYAEARIRIGLTITS